ncbi:hypothetical protein ACIRVN_34190 [Streptomyces albogriseolus]|uniref:hypothetical protein n=1 Tax=Streptomyces albogriseolus TaxID=1887 RepID=UPI00380DF18F
MTTTRTTLPRTRKTTVHSDSRVIPFVIQREGEEAAPDNLRLTPLGSGRYRLGYADEDPRDRDLRGVLWARCGFGPVDDQEQPTGRPQWRMMHPLRQRGCMQTLRCQICAGPARTPLGWIFLAGPSTVDPNNEPILTNQPPVCPEHVRTAAELCPHLTAEPMVFLARSAPLYGVNGVGYGVRDGNVQVVERPAGPVPYGHLLMPTVLASQMVRRIGAFRLLSLAELFTELERVA